MQKSFDFGRLTIDNGGLKENVPKLINLLDYVYLDVPASVRTVYALGNTTMTRVDKNTGRVRLHSDKYDWDYHNDLILGLMPQGKRDWRILFERMRSGVNNTHGFPIKFYGYGYIKQ